MADFTDIKVNRFFEDKTEFEANGKKFLIIGKSDLSISRNQHLHGYSEQIIRATQLDPQNKILEQVKRYLKAGDWFEASVYVSKQLESSQLYKSYPNAVLHSCATFIVREDEDKDIYNPEISESKIEDWTKEGLPWEAFFFLALKYSSQLAGNWAHFFQSVFQVMEEINAKNGSQ